MRHSTIFRSRWWALLWSAGVIWTAVSLIGTGDEAQAGNNAAAEDVTGAPVTSADLAVLGNFVSD